MNIAVIGRGNVGGTLGSGWAAKGHHVVYGVNNPEKPEEATNTDAVNQSEVVVVAIPAKAVNADFFNGLDLQGKTMIDATNPINAQFDGLDTSITPSQAETVARLAPKAKVVKAFNTVGFNVMANPDFNGVKASMLIASDHDDAKQTAMTLATDLGFDPVDAGPLHQAAELEALAWLWISMAVKFGHGREMAFVLHKR